MNNPQLNNNSLTDIEINNLISMPKDIIKPPKKNFTYDKTNHMCVHNSFECQSKDNSIDKFHIFIKKHCSLPSSFSIGLMYSNKNILLLRANGKHDHKNKDDAQSFNDFHIHKVSAKQLQEGITNSYHADPTKNYTSFNSALLHFCDLCGIIGIDKYFPDLRQISFFEE